MSIIFHDNYYQKSLADPFYNLKEILKQGILSVKNLGESISKITNDKEVKTIVKDAKRLFKKCNKLDMTAKPIGATQTFIEIGKFFIHTAKVLEKIPQVKQYFPDPQYVLSQFSGLLEPLQDTIAKTTPILQAAALIAEMVVPPPVGIGIKVLKISAPILKAASISLKWLLGDNQETAPHEKDTAQDEVDAVDDEYYKKLPKVKRSLVSLFNCISEFGEVAYNSLSGMKALSKTISSCNDLKNMLSNLDIKNPWQVGQVLMEASVTLGGVGKLVDVVKKDKIFIAQAKAILHKPNEEIVNKKSKATSKKDNGNNEIAYNSTVLDSIINVATGVESTIRTFKPLVEISLPEPVKVGVNLLHNSLVLLNWSCYGFKVTLGAFSSLKSAYHNRYSSAKKTGSKRPRVVGTGKRSN